MGRATLRIDLILACVGLAACSYSRDGVSGQPTTIGDDPPSHHSEVCLLADGPVSAKAHYIRAAINDEAGIPVAEFAVGPNVVCETLLPIVAKTAIICHRLMLSAIRSGREGEGELAVSIRRQLVQVASRDQAEVMRLMNPLVYEEVWPRIGNAVDLEREMFILRVTRALIPPRVARVAAVEALLWGEGVPCGLSAMVGRKRDEASGPSSKSGGSVADAWSLLQEEEQAAFCGILKAWPLDEPEPIAVSRPGVSVFDNAQVVMVGDIADWRLLVQSCDNMAAALTMLGRCEELQASDLHFIDYAQRVVVELRQLCARLAEDFGTQNRLMRPLSRSEKREFLLLVFGYDDLGLALSAAGFPVAQVTRANVLVGSRRFVAFRLVLRAGGR